MQASDAYRTWWAAGAIFIMLLVVDLFVYAGWADSPLETPFALFIFGLLTAVFLAATVVLRPRRVT